MPGPEHKFTPEDVETILSLCDTVIPAVSVSDLIARVPGIDKEVDPATLAAFAAETPSKNAKYVEEVNDLLPTVLSPEKLAELKQVVWLLRNKVGMLVLSGGLTPFHELSPADREKAMLSWKTSRIPAFRKIYDTFTKVGAGMYMRNSTIGHAAMQYRPKETPVPAEGHYQFTFLKPTELDSVAWDAVVVGSGSGGGVVAKQMAEAGMKVLIVERGQHFDHGEIYSEATALEHAYDQAGLAANDGGDIALIQGKVFGGGSAVNWAASLQTPAKVREDWVKTSGIKYFQTPEFQDDLDFVFKQMGVSAPTHNTQNQMLLEGARRMGFQRADVPQNTGGGPHACGHDCANLCRSGGKKGGVHSWLVDASNAGAKFITGADVRRIDFDAKKGRAARGVVLRFNDGSEQYVKTPRVLVCAGSILSPALLLRSKIPNSRIGQSLYLHPTNYVHAIFDHATHPVDGQILTSVVGEFADLDGSGHGVRIETGCMQPVLAMCLLQWANGLEAKARFLKHPKMVGCIAIARDAKPGKVSIDKAGEPIVDYTVANIDNKSIITGTIGAAECMKAIGAKEVIVAGRGIPEWREGDDWDAWVRKVTASTPGGYGSAHQMGSNRMGSSTSNGACDPTGAVYGVRGVWCADASVLPSASGVNPMVSTMAVATKISRGIVQAWREGRVETKPSKAKL